jgi:tetraprenyl-beta-curcumene synthase
LSAQPRSRSWPSQATSRLACEPRTSHQPSSTPDSAPLSWGQITALAAATTRELIWGLRAVSREVEHWRALAATIPDNALRRDAQAAIARKRANIDGAALFWTIPRARSLALLRLLVAYEILADYLDCTNERGAHVGIANGLQLHHALVDALDPTATRRDYYQHHPWSQDGGYLRALVETCRDASSRLPSYQTVKPLALHAARLTQILGINHETDPKHRDASLRTWAAKHFPDPRELAWWERAGGASAWLTILALLALAADSAVSDDDAREAYAAYLPWVSLAGTMLDSYGDMAEDAEASDHSYIAHYPSLTVASQRIIEIVERSLQKTQALRDGHRHVVVASCMIAMYLTKDSARTPQLRDTSEVIARAGGSLTRYLVPVLRTWRAFYNQRST